MTAPLRVYLSGQKEFGRQTLALLLNTPGVVVIGVSAPMFAGDGERMDRLRDLALEHRLPVLNAGLLNADRLAELAGTAGVDLILAAHSHDFIGRRTRALCRLGALGYHPSLLPRHRGRDAVRWTVKLRDPITGGTVFWLNDTVDGGPIAAQQWCWVHPKDTAASLWREKLAPLGLKLFARVLADLTAKRLVRVPQDPALATWEPSWERAPLARPDLLMLGDGSDRFAGWTVVADEDA